jgi:hypothetical protein
MSGWLLGPRRIGLLLLILFSVVHKSVGQPPPEQVESLIAFFDSTNGASWVNNASWTVGNPCLNSWYGVHCDTLDDKIETLLLSGNNLTGSLPPDLALPDLVELWVVLAHLTAGSQLTPGVHRRNLSFNKLEGTLPDWPGLYNVERM